MIERLYELGVKSPTGMDRWNKGTIESMVQNEKYAGHMSLGKTFIYNDTRVRSSRLDKQGNMIMNHHVPIVDPSIFDTAMAIRLNRTKNTIDGYIPFEKRATVFYQFVYSKENGRYLKYVLEKPKGKYNIPTLYCYNSDGKNRVMITVNTLYKIINASLDKLSKSINELGSSFSEIINNSLYKCDLSLKSNPENKIDMLSNKVLLLEAKKKLPSFIKSIKNFSDLDVVVDFRKLISGVEIIDDDTIKVKLSLVSDAILNYPVFESTISLKIGNSIKDITYYLFI